MKDGLEERGIDLGRINYQDNDNWKPELHVHLYGRAIDASHQIYGEPVKSARKLEDKVVQEPLTQEDCAAIRNKVLAYVEESGYESLCVS